MVGDGRVCVCMYVERESELAGERERVAPASFLSFLFGSFVRSRAVHPSVRGVAACVTFIHRKAGDREPCLGGSSGRTDARAGSKVASEKE